MDAGPELESRKDSPVELPYAESSADGLGPISRVFGVFLCGVLAFLCLYLTQPLLPLLAKLFKADKAAVGLTVSASTLGVAFTAPILGLVADRLSRKRLIVASTAVLALPTMLAATSPNLHVLIFWRFVQGVLIPGIFAITISYVTEEWPPRSVPLAMSFYVSGTALGGCLGRVLSGLITASWGWRASFLVMGFVTLAGSLLIARLLPKERARIAAHADITPRHLAALVLGNLRDTRLLATYFVGCNVLFALVAMFTYITFYLAAPPFLLSTRELSYLYLVYLIALVTTPAGGAILPTIGLRYGVVAASAISIAGALLTLIHSLPIIVLGLAVCSVGVFITQACATSYLHEAAPRNARLSAVGLYIAFYYVGGTLGGVAPSYLWRWGEWPACVFCIAAVYLLSICAAAAGWKTRSPRLAL